MNKIVELFDIEGNVVECVPHGGGYINDTYLVTCEKNDGEKIRYILQRINHNIFKDPESLMENFAMVCDYLKGIVEAAGGDSLRETLTVIPTKDGKNLVFVDDKFYRMLLFIEDIGFNLCRFAGFYPLEDNLLVLPDS